jgi:hypothetical protein
MNNAANRFGQGAGSFATTVSEPQTGTDSNHGSVIVTPTPRKKVRREPSAVLRLPDCDCESSVVDCLARLIFGSFDFRECRNAASLIIKN